MEIREMQWSTLERCGVTRADIEKRFGHSTRPQIRRHGQVWHCSGFEAAGHVITGNGISPAGAYWDWACWVVAFCVPVL